MKKFSKIISLILVLVLSLSMIGCVGKSNNGATNKPKEEPKKEPVSITLATTTSTDDSGLLKELLPVFEKDNNIKVKVVAVGTGQAIDLGKRGDADVLLVHARKAEDEFMAGGFGKIRKDVMYNKFVLVGPNEDPAGTKGTKVAEFLAKISEGQATFISRGDDSGTHKKELALWEKVGIKPEGSWYKAAGQGMGATLQMADELKAYTLADRATYLAQNEKLKLDILVEGDQELLNPYGVIAVSPDKFAHIKYEEAMKFIEFLTSPKGQELIRKFGVDEFGEPLFIPDAK